MPQWTLDVVTIAGGFLADFSVRFPPGLVCVIGPRGSGKSTLAEAIRLALSGLPAGATKARQEFIKATLGGAVLTVSTAPWETRGAITIRRVVGQEPTMTAGDGRPIASIDLDRGTFLPIDAYSGMEIELIADENLGVRRKALLDDLCRDELQPIHLALSEQRRSLESNADAIQSVRKRIAGLTEQMEELGDVQAQLESLPPSPEHAASPEFHAAAKQRGHNEKEGKESNGLLAAVRCLLETVSSAGEAADLELGRKVTVPDSENSEITIRIDEAVSEFRAALAFQIAGIRQLSGEFEARVAAIQADLTAVHAAQGAEYAKHQDLNQQAVRAYEARSAAQKSVARAEGLARQRSEAEEELEKMLVQRKALKIDHVLTREKISGVREKVAGRLQEQAGEKVRIRVQRNADALQYQERLTAALKGSNLRNQGDIISALTKVRPEDLAKIISDNDADELETQTALGRERGRKILDSLKLSEDPLKLEIVGTDDKICIELNVSTGADSNFKDASELSRGQKCTALLPILLARQDSPLVIDQPEDNLDNHFIYETVVGTILRLKKRRQMIFITHNANIPVLGGADLVLVMNSDGRRGFVQKTGSVDECRKEIIDLLEGGEEAFELRRRRYEREG